MKKNGWLKKSGFLCGIIFSSCIFLSGSLASCNKKSDEERDIQTESDVRLEENKNERKEENKEINKGENISETQKENIEVITEKNLEKNTGVIRDKDRTEATVEAEMTEEIKDVSSIEDYEYDTMKSLLPNTDLRVKETNAYLCRGMNKYLFKYYQRSLINQGYELMLEEIVGGYPYYQYANEENRIQVIDVGELVFVSIAKYYEDMAKEEKALSNEDALKLIQNKEELISYSVKPYNNTTQTSTKYPVDIIVKHWIKDLYTKTNILAYTAYSCEGRVVGTYLIQGDKAYEIFDTLENTCVADLDQNGTYELLTLYGYGFGLYHINVNVYQCENPIFFSSLTKILHLTYSNCFVPKDGYGTLNFHKISDSKVHLVDGEDGKDYGPLVILEDGVHIEPEYIEEFPYYHWDEDYNFSMNMDEDKNQNSMKEEPKLEVSIGDTVILSQARKVDWNGEAEEVINFKDIMNDTIPKFDSPPSMLEFTDEICLSFEDATPTSISVEDILITENGDSIYGERVNMIREVRIGEDGNYYFGLQTHMGLMLSSSTATCTNPSYRGFRVQCEFTAKKTCEYIFVLSLEPMWEDEE